MARCQTCDGKGVLPVDKLFLPCPSCNGCGIESCCDGEDRWQTDKMDDHKEWQPPEKPK